MAKVALTAKKAAGKPVKKQVQPKKLTKVGQWIRECPNGAIEVHDLKAMMV